MKQQWGVTLVELLLVLAIGASMLVLGFKQMNSFRRETEVAKVQATIDALFQAAAAYYYANCSHLTPSDTATNSYSVTLRQLKDDGYLDSSASFPPASAVADNTGYLITYKRITSNRTQVVCDPGSPANISKCGTPGNKDTKSATVGRVDVWYIELTVKMRNTGAAWLDAYKKYLGGISIIDGTILIDRLPRDVTNNSSQSTLWPSSLQTELFNQSYTTKPMSNLTNNDSVSNADGYQLFNCNS